MPGNCVLLVDTFSTRMVKVTSRPDPYWADSEAGASAAAMRTACAKRADFMVGDVSLGW